MLKAAWQAISNFLSSAGNFEAGFLRFYIGSPKRKVFSVNAPGFAGLPAFLRIFLQCFLNLGKGYAVNRMVQVLCRVSRKPSHSLCPLARFLFSMDTILFNSFIEIINGIPINKYSSTKKKQIWRSF